MKIKIISALIQHCANDCDTLTPSNILPLQFDGEKQYKEEFSLHVIADLRAEVKAALAKSDEKPVHLKSKRRLGENGNMVFTIKRHDLDYNADLLIVRSGNRAGILRFVKDCDYELEYFDAQRGDMDRNSKFEIIVGLSEYTKSLFVLCEDSPPCKHLQYIIGNEGPAPRNTDGWDSFGELDPSQAQAVASYLNSGEGVMLLEGPPGTGKSHTITFLVKQLVSRSERTIVVTAPSNKAIESIAQKLLLEDCDFCIVARKEKISPDLHYRLCKPDESVGKRIVLCTMSKCSTMSKKLSDVELIMDECGQASEPLSLIPFLLNPHRCLLVGDAHQLRPMVHHSCAEIECYKRSMLERLQLLSVDVYMTPVPRLSVCYRSHSDIIDLSNLTFYEGALTTGSERDLLVQEGLPFEPMCMIDVPAHSNSENVSYSEINTVVQTLQMLNSRPGIDIEKDVVVLCFYNKQLAALQSKLLKKKLRVSTSTVDSFQGSEKKIVIISFSRTQPRPGFLKDCNRLNVALTRAMHSLILVGNHNMLARSGKGVFLGKLMNTVKGRSLLHKSLEECYVLPVVQQLLSYVDETSLSNYFDTLKLTYPQALSIKGLEAQYMSSTVNSDLLRRSCEIVGSNSDATQRYLSSYAAKKYSAVGGSEGISVLAVFSTLCDFHTAEFSVTAYEDFQSAFQALANTSDLCMYLRLLSKSTGLWIRYRLLTSEQSQPEEIVRKMLMDYASILTEYKVAKIQGTKHTVQFAIVLLKLGHRDIAIGMLERVADTEDDSVDLLSVDDVYAARCMVAEALHARDGVKNKKVIDYLNRAVALSTKYSMQRAWAYEMLSGCYMDRKDFAKAFTHSRDALMRHPGNIHAYRIFRDAKEIACRGV